MLDWFFKGNKQIVQQETTKNTWVYQLGEHSITITKKPRMKRILVSVKKDGTIRASAPLRTPLKDIYSFIEEQRSWIESTLKKVGERKAHLPQFEFQSGQKLFCNGKEFELKVNWKAEKTKYQVSLGVLQLHLESVAPFDTITSQKLVHSHLQKFFQTQAVGYLPQRIAYWSERTGWPYRSLKLKNLKSMWGSCTNQKDIYLSWRLMVFDEKIIDYVIIHELAHTQHMNHSTQFWKCVQLHCPNFKALQKQIRAQQTRADFLLPYKA